MLALPSLNHFVEKDLLEGMTLSFWLIFLGIFCTGIILLGFYPALILTSLNNRDIIQGKFKYSRKGIVSRRIFMGIQFAASIAIIMVTLFVYRQIEFMKSFDKGFNPEQVICIDDNSVAKENIAGESFKTELLKFPQILNVTKAKTLPGNDVYLKEVIKRTDSDDSFDKIFEVMVADEDYIDVFQFKIIEGRKFSNKFSTDKQCVILNEEAVKCLNYNSPADAIDKEIVYRRKNYKIIGVIKNFNQLSLRYSIQPFAYFLGSQGFYAIKVKAANTKECISIIDNTIKKYYGGIFKYRFVDDFYNEQYKNEVKFGKLFTCFSIIIICLSSVGLFGLALYLAQQRRKEMAIRAINGAKHWKLLLLILKSYLVNIVVSFCIVCPLVYYSLNEWLKNFAYKTELSWWVFALAGIVTISIALLTVSWQGWKVARRNPVEALRYE
jgi:putative ABC transport system permease protein